MSDPNVIAAIEQIAGAFEEFKTKNDRRLDSFETRLARPGAGYSTAGVDGPREDFADLAMRELSDNLDVLRKNGRVNLRIKSLTSTDPVLAATVGARASLGPAVPSGGLLGIASVLPLRTEMAGTEALTYPRYTETAGGAAKQAGEGAAKSSLALGFTPISQSSLTIATWTRATNQALSSASQLRAIIQSQLVRAIRSATDDVLVNGSTAPGPTFEGFVDLATAHTSTTYTALPDAISEAQSVMQVAGFAPTAVVLNPSDWLAIQVAMDLNENYKAGSYLAPLPNALRGLRIALSSNVTAGTALLVDTMFCEVYEVDGLTLQVGFVDDDFVKNQIVFRAESRVIPVMRAEGAVTLVTPKAGT